MYESEPPGRLLGLSKYWCDPVKMSLFILYHVYGDIPTNSSFLFLFPVNNVQFQIIVFSRFCYVLLCNYEYFHCQNP